MAKESSNWEELRRQARQLENEIDLKLVSFSKLGTSYGSQDYRNENSDTVPLLSSSNSEHMFETMALEIEQLLSKLTDVNDKMISYCQTQTAPGATVSHTLQRHRDILQDCTHEFQKTKANIQARKEREQLLSSVRKDIDAYKSSSGLNRRTDLYLKEHEHIRNSEKMVDDQISIAVKTKEELMSQRIAMKAIQTKMTTLVNRFPVINSIIQRINLRKRRDSIILAIVISICLILFIIYTFH
ncbi:Golgi SNAP receptor complex member 1-like isoform X1 [Uloborus diversus]|uniref:Golgi SNAP receptor complex member 1-like isoform X1 n=1 Tax=Uloborus diversus TaxID=327109 RepID=UPI0024095C27|nr:Golgi SNAP receptor complex member 1-like isoform X1 [Uloborus diversus]